MKPEDLRIGNWVNDGIEDGRKVRNVQVVGIESNQETIWVNYANGSGVYTRNIKDLKPIPTRPEWLERFGFKKTHEGYIKVIFEDGYGEIRYMLIDDPSWLSPEQLALCIGILDVEKRKGIRPELDSGIDELYTIRYVHTLQNIWFDLTNKEL